SVQPMTPVCMIAWCCGILHLFFFSSRRRHTSFSRDWSSDVCSSDLALTAAYTAVSGAEQPHRQDVGKAAFESIIKAIAERKKALDVSQKLNRITIDHEASRNEADRQEG